MNNFLSHNPDVLDCIANLSSDEVFTPPKLANRILDDIARAWAADHNGENIWTNPAVKFLDPAVKSGVFLREITQRLSDGLLSEIPNLQQRVNHILTKQVFGISITELTGLLTRRSVYCSKFANGKYSVCNVFDNEQGNIWFERTEHSWIGGIPQARIDSLTGDETTVYVNRRCEFCGASEADYNRGTELETHAYAFIHTHEIKDRLENMFGADMHFDVVIGNPPYQLSDGGFGKSAAPIYQYFVEQAKKLDPTYLSMIIPSRWFVGGKGLSDFRKVMLSDTRIQELHDFPDSREVFPEVDVAGGICYFLWAKHHSGPAIISTHRKGTTSVSRRPLLEPGNDVFVRDNVAISILRKIYSKEMRVSPEEALTKLPSSKQFSQQVSARKPFGLPTNFRAEKHKSAENKIAVIHSGGVGWTSEKHVLVGREAIAKWKAYTSKASHDHAGQPGKDGTRRVLGRTGISQPGTVVTETYIILGAFDTKEEAESCISYARTRLFRFLVSLRSSTQDITRTRFEFVPMQKWDRDWSDEELYQMYGLNTEEIAYIKSVIRPMEAE